MASVWLPSIIVLVNMRRRADRLPSLMAEAVQDNSPSVTQRAIACLYELSVLAGFAQHPQFALYCNECQKLLRLYQLKSSQQRLLSPILLGAAIRVSNALQNPSCCQIDSANLNELRLARGANAVEAIARESNMPWPVPLLKKILQKQLLRAHYTLEDGANISEYPSEKVQHNDFFGLNRVAAQWLGNALLRSVEDVPKQQQTCMQILRLELVCTKEGNASPPIDYSSMKVHFMRLSIEKYLSGLGAHIRELLQSIERGTKPNILVFLQLFYEVAACCQLLRTQKMQSTYKVCSGGQQLALHLRCWEDGESEGKTLLCLCMLTLERHIECARAEQNGHRPHERSELRLQRKVLHFIRTHRKRLRSSYAVPIAGVDVGAHKEMMFIHETLWNKLNNDKKSQETHAISDEYFHAVIRFKAIALCRAQMGLYELLCNLREFLVLTIESQIVFTKYLAQLLVRLSAFSLRSFKQGRRELGYDSRLINTLSEQLRVQRPALLVKRNAREKLINLPRKRGKKRDNNLISTDALPVFLAKNVRISTTDYTAIYRCETSEEFARLSSATLLELTFLSRGARALQVDRVAALSEALLAVYRSLNACSMLPQNSRIDEPLSEAHRCLRLALNQAAARQNVCDVRPVIGSLYHVLESLHQTPENAPHSLQIALKTVNSLAADMRTFEDLFASVANRGQDSRKQLAQEQLQRIMVAARQLQEDLSATSQVCIARWGPDLINAVGRYSNERNKAAQLELGLAGVRAARALVQKLLLPLQTLLALLIEFSIESPAQRCGAGKSASAKLMVRARRVGSELVVDIQDDGVGLEASHLEGVSAQVHALGGSLSLAPMSTNGSRIRLKIAAESPHWDIAAKPL